MKRFVLFIFLLLFCLVAWVFSATKIQAKEGDCHLKHCLVPAPTILLPENDQVLVNQPLVIRGLTWKTTIVKVFLDGRELSEVKQRKHEDYYASFFIAVSEMNLKPGKHFLYTIAFSEKPGWYDQSFESTYINFEVKKTAVGAVAIQDTRTQNEVLAEETSQLTQGTAIEIKSPQTSLQKIEVKEPIEPTTTFETAKGLSDLGERLNADPVKESTGGKKADLVFGLVIVLVLTLIWLVKKWLRREHLLRDDQSADQLPPPPEPPANQGKLQ